VRAARLAAPFPKAALDWCEDMAALLDVADATFTKAGGLSVSEAMAKGGPVLVGACEGGLAQESGTAGGVEGGRCGCGVPGPEEVVRILGETSAGEWAERRRRALESVRGGAATIAQSLLALLRTQVVLPESAGTPS